MGLAAKMIYRSNLEAPDLSRNFKLKDPPLTIMSHDMPSDPDYEPDCGFWTHDEAAILYHCASRAGGEWLDIGSRFGWTSAYIAAGTGMPVWGVDPMYQITERIDRAMAQCPEMVPIAMTSAEFLGRNMPQGVRFEGIVIDGCHDAPEPMNDAINAALLMPSVILFHDFQGLPVRQAVTFLMKVGWQCRVYDTPNGVSVLWRDKSFFPPLHVPDPAINWKAIRARYTDFDYARTV